MSTNEALGNAGDDTAVSNEDLDLFSADFFQSPASDDKKQDAPESANSEEDPEDNREDDDANEDTQLGEVDTPADEQDDDPTPVKKKSRAQERIEELNARYRETERQLNELKARLEQKEEPKPQPQVEVVNKAPSPDDVDESGNDKYPLGEFDPAYIRDLTRHTLNEEREALKAREQAETQQREADSQKAALVAQWEEKLVPARERYPDFQERGQELVAQFDGINPQYGEYLTATIMSMDYGTDVLYHLATHPDEARAIVNSGAAKATIALGRLEAKFADAEAEKQLARPKISKAPTPPAHINKGSAVAKAVAPDTDDLDAFASEFFKKGRN